MGENRKKRYPKRLEEIVEDLRSKGELDEEKWKDYQGRWGKAKSHMAKAYVIPSLVLLWMIYRGCDSSGCVSVNVLALLVAPPLFMKSIQNASIKTIYQRTYWVPRKAVVDKVSDYKGGNIQKIVCSIDGEDYRVEFSREYIPHYCYTEGDFITVWVDPENTKSACFFDLESSEKFNLRKEE